MGRILNNLTGGEIDPLLYDRVDLKQHSNGAKSLRNCRLLPQGGFTRRPGSRFVEALLPVLSRITADVTITTPRGGTGANANDGEHGTAMATSTSVSTINPYVVAHYDLGSAKAVVLADVVGFRVSSGTADFSDWFIQYSTDNITFTSLGAAIPLGNGTIGERTRRRTGPITARYWRVARIGATDYGAVGVSLREFNLWQTTATLSEHRRVPFLISAAQKYMLLFTDYNARVYKKVAGVPVRQADIRTGFASGQLSYMNWTQSLDTLVAVHEDVRPHLIQRQGSDSEWDAALVFLGEDTALNGTVSIEDVENEQETSNPTDSRAGYQLTNTGIANIIVIGGFATEIAPEQWFLPRRAIVSGELQVRATQLAGAAPTSGTIGTWEDLSTTRTWYNEETGIGTKTSTLLIEIRNAVTQVVLDSATVIITAVVSP